MTSANGISIDLSTYSIFCRIIMMIKLTGVVCLLNLRQRKGEQSYACGGIKDADASGLTDVLSTTFQSRIG
jgi:hypothetical protein